MVKIAGINLAFSLVYELVIILIQLIGVDSFSIKHCENALACGKDMFCDPVLHICDSCISICNGGKWRDCKRYCIDHYNALYYTGTSVTTEAMAVTTIQPIQTAHKSTCMAILFWALLSILLVMVFILLIVTITCVWHSRQKAKRPNTPVQASNASNATNIQSDTIPMQPRTGLGKSRQELCVAETTQSLLQQAPSTD